jgi:hypothetical protein
MLSQIAMTVLLRMAGSARPVFSMDGTGAGALAAVAVLGVFADVLDRHHMLVLGGTEPGPEP